MSQNSRPGEMSYTADKYRCYEIAVQCVESEVDMIQQTYQNVRGKPAVSLREDFCGTANTSCEWIRRDPSHTALSLDINQEVLDWGLQHNIKTLSLKQQQRIQLLNQNVLNYTKEKADILIAMNFSYQLFKTRKQLLEYFRRTYEGLSADGMLFIDAFGGHESWKELQEKTQFKDFTYYWDQAKYDPVTAHMLCHIHFRFKDGSWLKNAFSYNWRMWTLPELQEILYEAGYKNVIVYWEQTDEESGEGNGEYLPATEGEADPSWIVYLSGKK